MADSKTKKEEMAKPLKIDGVPNLQRGLHILEYLASHNKSATISELAERLDYPTASVYRITNALEGLGYLARDAASKRYTLTNRMLLLGQPQNTEHGLVESALPAMRGLRKATMETTQLCCLVEKDNVVLEQLLALHPFKYSSDLGARCPSYSCAPGKAMIASLPEDERETLIGEIEYKKFTETTIGSKEEFQDEIQDILKSGYSLDRAEGMAGVHCVAAPICDRHGYPVGALTITAPSSRLKRKDFKTLGPIVQEAAMHAATKYNQC